MESIAHSRQSNKASVTVSKKICNGYSGGFQAQTLYDDVYGGPPKFGISTLSPRAEDYSEIFSAFHTARASSIPVLDLPVVDETEVLFDLRSSGFDYSEVFGGFSGIDFAVSYEDLLQESKSQDCDSSEEAWTPVDTGSLSGESENSGKNPSLSNKGPYQTEFSISYHKVNQKCNESMVSGEMHVTQLPAVPGFTQVFDESALLRTMDPALQVVSDENMDPGFGSRKMKGNYLVKSMSQSPNNTVYEGTHGDDLKPHTGYSQHGSQSNETFITVSEISLKTQPSDLPPPSRPPPPSFPPPPTQLQRRVNANRSNLDHEQIGLEGSLSDSSPALFDVEVDMCSSASVKEVIDTAQENIGNSKEKMKRKEDWESKIKVSSKHEVKDNEVRMSKIIDKSNSLKGERVHGTYVKEHNGKKISTADGLQNAAEISQDVVEPLERERVLNMSKESSEDMHNKDSRSSQDSDASIGVGEWKAATEYFELVRTENSGETFELASNDKMFVNNTKIHDHGQKVNKARRNWQDDEITRIKTIQEIHKSDESKKKLKAAKEACEPNNIRNCQVINEYCRQSKHMKKAKKVQNISKHEDNDQNAGMVYLNVQPEKEISGTDQSIIFSSMVETQHKHKQSESNKLKEADKQGKHEYLGMKDGEKETEDSKQVENLLKQKESGKRRDSGKIRQYDFASVQADGEKKVECTMELEEKGIRLEGAFKQGEVDGKRKEPSSRVEEECELKTTEELGQNEDNHKHGKDALKNERTEKGLKDAINKDETRKGLQKVFEHEENVRGLKGTSEKTIDVTSEKKEKKGLKEAYKRSKNKKGIQELRDGEGMKKSPGEALKDEKSSRRMEKEQGNSDTQTGWNKGYNGEGDEKTQEDSYWEKGEKILEDADGKNLNAVKETKFSMNNKEIKLSGDPCNVGSLKATQSAHASKETKENLEQTQQSLHDKENVKTRPESRESEMKVEMRREKLQVDNRSKAPGLLHVDSEHETKEFIKKECKNGFPLDGSAKKSGESSTSIGKECDDITKNITQNEYNPRILERKFARHWSDIGKSNHHAHVFLNHEDIGREKVMPNHAKMSSENGNKTEAALPNTLERKRSMHGTAQWSHSHQSMEEKEKFFIEALIREDKESGRMKRERELETERLRKLEEEREREREREKDRMAVDMATLEASERAYTEARERAERSAVERATAEARQRALAEARERLDKACAEAREKSFVDKATTEARVRTEHAAVEKATYDTRERLDRSASFRNRGSYTGSRYPYSSTYGDFTGKPEEIEGESAQRCKARMERYHRTAERAAKALAEKNMRDLIAQKERAERNRLAETLDAEVRRWSGGKEGNLRALLSTLQYILGPDSGWHPIPLTEVITVTAVRKAYRKATLCVHPDKLQQRGASIQHKYICEKVFDLLKEAWNKFNSEER